MSIKSLLQLILFLLIILTIGGIHFLYFYSDPEKNRQTLEETSIENINKELQSDATRNNEEMLEDIQTTNKKNILINEQSNEINSKLNKKSEKINKELGNLTKEIEYITKNKNGDIFKILAKYGKTNLENSNILDLENVNGIISSDSRSEIYVRSDYAEYNYTNQESKFYSNVEIRYDNNRITCENLDLIISDNIAVAYNNVVINKDNSLLKAEILTLNITTKDININSKESVKVIKN